MAVTGQELCASYGQVIPLDQFGQLVSAADRFAAIVELRFAPGVDAKTVPGNPEGYQQIQAARILLGAAAKAAADWPTRSDTPAQPLAAAKVDAEQLCVALGLVDGLVALSRQNAPNDTAVLQAGVLYANALIAATAVAASRIDTGTKPQGAPELVKRPSRTLPWVLAALAGTTAIALAGIAIHTHMSCARARRPQEPSTRERLAA